MTSLKYNDFTSYLYHDGDKVLFSEKKGIYLFWIDGNQEGDFYIPLIGEKDLSLSELAEIIVELDQLPQKIIIANGVITAQDFSKEESKWIREAYKKTN